MQECIGPRCTLKAILDAEHAALGRIGLMELKAQNTHSPTKQHAELLTPSKLTYTFPPHPFSNPCSLPSC